MEQVQKTIIYDQFKFLKGNRKIDRYHLKKLKESIEKNNHLNLHPIIVNANMEIIDGQHRYEAAKLLGLEIFFIKSESVHDDHLIASNVNQRSWEVENYIDYFSIKEKLPDYVELKNLMELSELKPKAILSMILGTISPEILNFMKTGKFRFPANKEYEKTLNSYLDFMSYVKDKRIKPISMFSNFYFTKAYRWLCSTNGFEYEILIKKLDLRWFDLKPQRVAEDWYKLLISIYNFKNHQRLDDEYTQKA
jgi:hypothetical protein